MATNQTSSRISHDRLAKAALAVGAAALMAFVAGCGGGTDESSSTSSDQSSAAPSTQDLDAVEDCVIAWQAEKRAAESGTLDDASLRETGRVCPDLETWEVVRDQVGYEGSPNILIALCAIEPDTPVCIDAKNQGALD